MAYCTSEDVYDSTSLTSDDVDSSKLTKLIETATANLNADINVRVNDELVTYIDGEKENDLDGSNTVYYTKNHPIGDYNDDGNISIKDIKVYTIDNDGVRTSYTVSSIDDDEIGKFTLSSAPSSNETLYISYVYSPLECETPHALIKRACIYLTAALGYTKIDADRYKTIKLGRLSAMKFDSNFDKYMKLYHNTVTRINDRMVDIVEGTKFAE